MKKKRLIKKFRWTGKLVCENWKDELKHKGVMVYPGFIVYK